MLPRSDTGLSSFAGEAHVIIYRPPLPFIFAAKKVSLMKQKRAPTPLYAVPRAMPHFTACSTSHIAMKNVILALGAPSARAADDAALACRGLMRRRSR